MKLTYANVMSTLAMLAATTTGTSYAAAQLGANSVGSPQIRNGQVKLADLAPSVRRQLAAPAAGGGTAGAKLSTAWRAIPAFNGTEFYECAAALCPTPGVTANGYGNRLALSFPVSGTVQFRLTGSVTHSGNFPLGYYIKVDTASTYAGLDAETEGKVVFCNSDNVGGLPVGTTKAISCGIGEMDAARSKFVRVQVVGVGRTSASPDGSSTGKLTGSIKLEVRKSPI